MLDKTFKKYCLVIDEWFANGQNGVKAYQKIYPKSSYISSDTSFRGILEKPRIKEYIKQKRGGLKKETKYRVQDAVKSDLSVLELFETILNRIANLDGTETEEERRILELQLKLFNSSLLNGAKDRLNKLCGLYEKDNTQKKPEINLPNFNWGESKKK